MGSQTTSFQMLSSSLTNIALNSPQTSIRVRTPNHFPLQNPTHFKSTNLNLHKPRFQLSRTGATLDEQSATSPLLGQESKPNIDVEESVKALKEAAKTRKVPKEKVLSALSVIENAKLNPSKFLETLGGSKSPGRTWMLIFTAEKQLKGGKYFPLTAVQRFDATAKRIENGVYLGPIGALTFEGRFSWKNRILAFIFECIRIKVGPLDPLEISLGQKDDREPSTKDPFFIWFYIDDELAVARGRSGGTAFWCRCRHVTT